MAADEATDNPITRRAALLAVLAMLGGAGLLELYMRHFEARMTGGRKTQVLTLTRDLNAGDVLSKEMLLPRELPAAYLEARHVQATDLDKVLGMRVGAGLSATESLLWSDLASFNPRERTLAGLVLEGMRAVTIGTSRGSFGAMLRPGDHVDVLHLRKSDGADPRPDGDKLLLRNVLVLAVGNDLEARAERGGRSTHNELVTLSVTPDAGQLLARAELSGSLRLLLRNPDDVLSDSSAAGSPPGASGPQPTPASGRRP